MTSTVIEMSEDEFDDRYPLLTNHLNPQASWAFGDGRGCLFETYGEELEFVRQQDPHTVWTFVDGDDGDQYLMRGFHLVNRIGYLVSAAPIPEGVDIEVRIPMDTFPENPSDDRESTEIRADHPTWRIARDDLGIPALDTRGSDARDFHDSAVRKVEAARKAAFHSGVLSAKRHVEPRSVPPAETIPVRSTPPLMIPRGTPLVPGKMYLRLYHGRTDPAQQMDDWGFAGPTFGPLSSYVHTYCCTFRIHDEEGIGEVWLDRYDDLIRWDGCFYGDLEVFVAGTNDRA